MTTTLTITRLGEDDFGTRIYRIENGYDTIATWLNANGGSPDQITGHDVDEHGHHTFTTGAGYDGIDADLFGGNGDGSRKKQFERAHDIDIVIERA